MQSVTTTHTPSKRLPPLPISTDTNNLGSYIRARRIQLDMLSSNLACLANLRRPYICQVEDGSIKKPSLEKLTSIATVLELDMKTLITILSNAGITYVDASGV